MAAILLQLKDLDRLELPRLRYITSTAQALPPRHIARLREMVEESSLIRVIWVDRLIEELAWQKFLQYDDKDISMVDCTSFAVMEQWGISTAFTFDRHFLQAGFQTWTEL